MTEERNTVITEMGLELRVARRLEMAGIATTTQLSEWRAANPNGTASISGAMLAVIDDFLAEHA